MRSAILKENIVINVIVGELEESVPCNDDVGIGWTYDGDNFSAPAQVFDINSLKSSLKTAIDLAAENERLKYITPGAGQALTYQQKADEAKRYLSSEDPDPTDYPLLSAEVGITGSDLAGVAKVVNAAFTQWQIIGAAIEKTRLAAKPAIDAATTPSEAQAAYEGASWPVIPN